MKNVALNTSACGEIGQEPAIIHTNTGGDLILAARSTTKLLALEKELEDKYRIEVSVITDFFLRVIGTIGK